MKKILGVPSLVIALVLSMVILPANAIAAFSDVSPSAWYANDVASVQQYGIINGTGNGKFSPNGTLTLAQAITMAARTYAHINCETIPTEGDSTWYAPYLRYADEKGICAMGEFGGNYNGECSRFTMALLFERVVPQGTDITRNEIYSLPDVLYTTYTYPVFHLYQLGVLTGSDKYGTFNPDKNITRAETAAILHRVLEPSARKTVTLLSVPSDQEIIDSACEQFLEYYRETYDLENNPYINTMYARYWWRLQDLNGDGVNEIIMGFASPDETEVSQVHTVYVVEDYQAKPIASQGLYFGGGFHEGMTICDNGYICNSWYGSWGEIGINYYKIANGSLVLVESVFYDMRNGTFYYSATESAYAEPSMRVSEEFYDVIINQYTDMTWTL